MCACMLLFYKQAFDSIEVMVVLLLTVEKMNKKKTMEKAIPFLT